MDYVKEELLRQNRALEALMRTGMAEEDPAEQEDSARQSFGSKAETGEGRIPPRKDFEAGQGAGAGSFRETLAREKIPLWTESPEEAGGRLWESERLSVRREESVRAMSRAIERDARRYDGGFTMY